MGLLSPVTDHSAPISDVDDAGWLTDFMKAVKPQAQDYLNDALNKCATALQTALQGTSAGDWVFPVGKTFTPSDVTALAGDLTINIGYAEAD
jgi:hypothetical protein